MEPANFDRANATLGPPAGQTEDEVRSLRVRRGALEGRAALVSCWRPSAAEMEEVQRTGRVWLVVQGATMPPVAVLGHEPELDVESPDRAEVRAAGPEPEVVGVAVHPSTWPSWRALWIEAGRCPMRYPIVGTTSACTRGQSIVVYDLDGARRELPDWRDVADPLE